MSIIETTQCEYNRNAIPTQDRDRSIFLIDIRVQRERVLWWRKRQEKYEEKASKFLNSTWAIADEIENPVVT